jgi:hypothetical protein
MTALEALMIAGLYVVPQPPYNWSDPKECIVVTEQGKTIECTAVAEGAADPRKQTESTVGTGGVR